MTASFSPPAAVSGRFAAAVLVVVVCICVAMIGGVVYLKYQLDHAESLLAAPDDALDNGGELLDRLRRDLGYGGFIGLAQNYVLSHDASGFAAMKDDIQSADNIVAHLPDHTPTETRHDLTQIVATFDAAMQRLNAPAGFTAADLAPLYAALPVLDARVESANDAARLAAQGQIQFWAMLLTMVSWCSLIIAAACAAGIYLALRDKHSAPMRALAQSIQNMARGDMRTAIWGIERQDMIGELARAVDIARYHFSHLPDLSLLSEQGPLRMKFEGGARSLFEAMMKSISRDSETIRTLAATLGESVQQQKSAITEMTEKVETVLQNILQRGQNGDAQIKQAIQDMVTSAENLKNAHAHAADQLNRMLPSIEERVHGMAEIAQITGKQVAQTLQSLTVNEISLKANANQTREILAQLSSTAGDLGERMFGAINLLQAGGKVLSETTEQLQGELLRGEKTFTVDPGIVQPVLERIDQVAAQIASMQSLADTRGQNQTTDVAAALAQIGDKFDALAQSTIAHTIQPPPGETALQTQEALAALSGKIATLADQLPADVRQAMQSDMQRLTAQMDAAREHIEQRVEQQTRAAIVQMMDAANNVRDSLGNALRDMAATLAAVEQSVPHDLQQHLKDQWYQLAAQVESSRASIETVLESRVTGRLASFEESLAATRDAVTAARRVLETTPAPSLTLPPELQKQLGDQWYQLAAQIEATRANMVETVSQRIAILENRLLEKSNASPPKTAPDYGTQRHFEQQAQILGELVATLGIIDTHMQQIKSEIRAKA